MDLTPPPLQSPIAGPEGKLPSAFPAWAAFFAKLHLLVNASCQSGTTANRPTQGLYPFRPYGDTTLNLPICRNAANTAWIKYDGTAA